MVSKVIFRLDKKRDIWNCLDTLKHRRVFGLQWDIDSKLLAKIKGKNQNKAKQIIIEFASQRYKKEYEDLNRVLRSFESSWRTIEKKYFRRLEQTLQKPICAKTFYACLTTLSSRCPWLYYKKGWMVFYERTPEAILRTCAHELLHMQFKRWHQRMCLKYLNWKQKEHLREALTFLLNEKEFIDLIPIRDYGYPAHQKLRAKFSEEWHKTRDFNKFLPKAIGITKRMVK